MRFGSGRPSSVFTPGCPRVALSGYGNGLRLLQSIHVQELLEGAEITRRSSSQGFGSGIPSNLFLRTSLSGYGNRIRYNRHCFHELLEREGHIEGLRLLVDIEPYRGQGAIHSVLFAFGAQNIRMENALKKSCMCSIVTVGWKTANLIARNIDE
jgi:hypothetical protein